MVELIALRVNHQVSPEVTCGSTVKISPILDLNFVLSKPPCAHHDHVFTGL